MKRILIMLLAIMLFGGCSNTEENAKVEYKKISATEAKTIIDKDSNIVILDVRTQEEFDTGHIKNAVLLPDTDIKQRASTVLPDKKKQILVYCRSGRRSAIASQELISMGYTNVVDFGGIIDWTYDIVK